MWIETLQETVINIDKIEIIDPVKPKEMTKDHNDYFIKIMFSNRVMDVFFCDEECAINWRNKLIGMINET